MLPDSFLPADGDGTSASRLGLFGDMFGAISAVFTGLAFAGIVVAIFLQRKHIQLQSGRLESERQGEPASRLLSAGLAIHALMEAWIIAGPISRRVELSERLDITTSSYSVGAGLSSSKYGRR